MKNSILIVLSILFCSFAAICANQERFFNKVLTSTDGHKGNYPWKMKKAGDLSVSPEKMSTIDFSDADWMPAIVPGTLLNSLVYNKVYPEPYFGLNNKMTSNIIPDISHTGRDFYTYWFRTEFLTDRKTFENKNIWLQLDGINYRAEVWLNGKMVDFMAGMFCRNTVKINDYVRMDGKNILAIKVYPIDYPGGPRQGVSKSWGAIGEFRNGGNGEIGKNVTQLMTIGWDFTFLDGIRDRNTGIWKDILIYTTGRMALRHPFVKSVLKKPERKESSQTLSVEVHNPNSNWGTEKVKVTGEIDGINCQVEKEIDLFREEVKTVVFTPEEFPQLRLLNPRLWWPLNKGKQELYTARFKIEYKGAIIDSMSTRFGIRDLTSDTNTPDKSRTFYINGKPIFIRGSNWIPENMLRDSEERTYAQLRYTAQAGVNLLRMWGGGITESDYFYQLCDEMGILVWTEFWMTGDTKHPQDESLYYKNVESTVKRIRNHPSLAYYVSSNESTEMPQTEKIINELDGTRGYQMQSECAGVHDGSPYKQVNTMRHYENTASDRGSRVDGFNPEYGTPCLPTVECLREMMDEKDLWPINKEVWDYSDGNGFHLMTSMYTDLVNEYGPSESIDAFAEKAQFVGAMNFRSIWEVWNENKLNYGDRYCSGLLFWYHNPPIRQVCARMWDWSLEPTAALYYSQNALQPLHPQFDYLTNTVSVVNDYYQAFNNFKVIAEVYDLDSKLISRQDARLNLPENGVANDVLKISFPKTISEVCFINLRLLDDKNIPVGDAFYWRSNDLYQGKETLTGPATSGFQAINKLKTSTVKVKWSSRKDASYHYILVELKNPSSMLAFFTQIQWLDKYGKPIRPSFYTDNFFSLLPGAKKTVTIETSLKNMPEDACTLVVKGINQKKQRFTIK